MRTRYWQIFLICLALLTTSVFPYGCADAAINQLAAQNTTKKAYVYLFGGSNDTYKKQLTQTKGNIDGVFVPWLDIDAQGVLKTTTDPAFLTWLHQEGYKVYPYLTNHFNRTSGDKVLQPDQRSQLVDQIVDFVRATGCDGVNIDLENFSPAEKNNFILFLNDLNQKLNRMNKELSVAVIASTSLTPHPASLAAAYDYEKIGTIVDRVIIMSYDQHWNGSEPGPVAGKPWVEKVVQTIAQQIPHEKLILGIPFYGRYWGNGKKGDGLLYPQAIKLAQTHQAPLIWDATESSWQIKYVDEQGPHEIWIDDRASLMSKMRFIHTYNLGGVAAWRLGQEDPLVWQGFQPWLQQLDYLDTVGHWASGAIRELVLKDIMSGRTDGRFYPDQAVTRAEAAKILTGLLKLPAGKALPFRDLSQDHWAYDSISRAYGARLLTGYPDNTVHPDQPITRGEVALLLCKAYQLPLLPKQSSSFSDVTDDHFAAQSIATIAARHWVNGYPNGTFGPQKPVTRAEMAQIINQARAAMAQ
ncbi:S-layer homology domain-containing protein [Heliophilum fasciatum]|uniref:S-layer family protein n=1 Tax=Heliophilum fasciatum TaxID=35700 RepID=A0A4R2RI63_9FIRM|nr:S-layer homology domain-containing protein [Heliophilum fasciatum]MCW2278507.1 spore germination protein YaaH [Heliophilum fasciatum]TCP63462.1 S-layer family protein [Heliophilum fasciatum]